MYLYSARELRERWEGFALDGTRRTDKLQTIPRIVIILKSGGGGDRLNHEIASATCRPSRATDSTLFLRLASTAAAQDKSNTILHGAARRDAEKLKPKSRKTVTCEQAAADYSAVLFPIHIGWTMR